MAGASAAVTLVPASMQQEAVDMDMLAFMREIEVHTYKEPEKLSGGDHINRLYRPGAKYFNMNPFEVLGLRHTCTLEEVRKAYRRMSVQVHPDKNPGNERSQGAFEIVKEAHERLEDEERMGFCQKICTAAEDATHKKVASAKKRSIKDGGDGKVPEDEPDRMLLSVKIMISRMFAEFESRKKQLEERDKEQRKRAREEQAEKEFMDALAKREQKMWEKSRQKRVNGWRAWANTGGNKSKIPSRVKEERRADGKSGYNAANDEKGDSYKKDWR
jgi:DnaJ family protein C protein 8|tara:strand:+ start:130 stop:948 length:819 start_codon:yes stop_codon:yes gene_type:complete